jgi:hypothetical protein
MTAATFKEFALQDGNARRRRSRSRHAVDRFHLNDQEILLRHLHKVVGDWVDDCRLTRAVA